MRWAGSASARSRTEYPSSETKPLPASLGEALVALEDDDVLTSALGSELMELFLSAKGLEWEAYRRQVTGWERDTYFQRC